MKQLVSIIIITLILSSCSVVKKNGYYQSRYYPKKKNNWFRTVEPSHDKQITKDCSYSLEDDYNTSVLKAKIIKIMDPLAIELEAVSYPMKVWRISKEPSRQWTQHKIVLNPSVEGPVNQTKIGDVTTESSESSANDSNWGWVLLIGILAIAIGALLTSVPSGIAYVGVLLALAGLIVCGIAIVGWIVSNVAP